MSGCPTDGTTENHALHQLLNEGAGNVHWYPRVGMHQGACVQNRLRLVQRRHVGAFKKLPDWNLFAPKQRLSHGGHPVRGIMGWIVLELSYAWPKPLVGVVVVIGDAGTEHIEEREPFMLDPLLDQFREVLLFSA